MRIWTLITHTHTENVLTKWQNIQNENFLIGVLVGVFPQLTKLFPSYKCSIRQKHFSFFVELHRDHGILVFIWSEFLLLMVFNRIHLYLEIPDDWHDFCMDLFVKMEFRFSSFHSERKYFSAIKKKLMFKQKEMLTLFPFVASFMNNLTN